MRKEVMELLECRILRISERHCFLPRATASLKQLVQFATNPTLLLDEPARDPQETDELAAFIKKQRDFNLTVFLIEHHIIW